MFKIAIDGPAGSGKSTIAKEVAKQLGFNYLSTGKFYRAYAYIMNMHQYSIEQLIDQLSGFQIVVKNETVLINGVDVSNQLNNETIGNLASKVAVNPTIRNLAVQAQRAIGKTTNIVMDGRDIGTVVLPDAQLKIFLYASPQVRAERRIKELNLDLKNLQQIQNEIQERDARDSSRKIAPLIQAKDAIFIDSSYLSISTIVNQIISLYKERV